MWFVTTKRATSTLRRAPTTTLRLIRDLLAFEPIGRGTDVTLALERLNRTLKRRAIIFLISDFLLTYDQSDLLKAYERALLVTNRRHDLVAVSITDPRETAWPNVGLVALEDAETGARRWIDSGDPSWRETFAVQATVRCAARDAAFTRAQVDHIGVTVGEDYVEPLLAFFRARARRWRR